MSFSVLIRTHNRIKDLELALKSVLNQKFLPKEVLILDDLNEIIVKKLIDEIKYKCKFSNIFYINTKNQFNSLKNLNLNANKCSGEFLAFLDDDDTWSHDYLEINRKVLINNDIVYTNFYEIKNTNKTVFKINKLNFKDNILTNNGFLISNLIVKKSSFDLLNGFDYNLRSSADKDFYLQAKLLKQRIYIQHIPLVNYSVTVPLNKWKWSNDYFSTLPGVLMFYKKYFLKISISLHVKMIKKIIMFILLSIRQKIKNEK